MNSKEQIYYLLKHYYKGEYKTDIFVDEFYRIFSVERDDNLLKLLSEEEYKLLIELSNITDYFSPYEEDFKVYSYTSEKEVKEKATEVYLKLTRK
ncbi:MAG: hypothetical protein FWF50_04220 [Defluviitaleaceae bacterium]|nr:hypothetical protein [Defluviitaleaceae bacterium]